MTFTGVHPRVSALFVLVIVLVLVLVLEYRLRFFIACLISRHRTDRRAAATRSASA